MAENAGTEATATTTHREDEIRALVERLGRLHRSGGTVIERAAILAEGADCSTVERWIVAHGGEPEASASSSAGGLHSPRLSGAIGNPSSRPPARYVLPPGALN